MNDEATASACSRCTSLERKLAELHARIAELEAKLGNNSSKPPSSDPPWKSSAGKPRCGKKHGGQPGHPGTFRQRLPFQRVKNIRHYILSAYRARRTRLNGYEKSTPNQLKAAQLRRDAVWIHAFAVVAAVLSCVFFSVLSNTEYMKGCVVVVATAITLWLWANWIMSGTLRGSPRKVRDVFLMLLMLVDIPFLILLMLG